MQIGWKQKDIAAEIGVHPSTVSREIQRNTEECIGEYRYQSAQCLTELRHQNKPKYTVITDKVEKYIRTKLKEHWSPEQIAGRMQYEGA